MSQKQFISSILITIFGCAVVTTLFVVPHPIDFIENIQQTFVLIMSFGMIFWVVYPRIESMMKNNGSGTDDIEYGLKGLFFSLAVLIVYIIRFFYFLF